MEVLVCRSKSRSGCGLDSADEACTIQIMGRSDLCLAGRDVFLCGGKDASGEGFGLVDVGGDGFFMRVNLGFTLVGGGIRLCCGAGLEVVRCVDGLLLCACDV